MALTKVSGDFIQDGSITQGHLHASHGITTSDIGEGSNLYFTTARVDSRIGDLSTSDLSEGTNLYYTDARVGSYLTTNSYATQSYVNTQVSNLVDSAPSTLDTLNELAAALGDDANFSTTVTNSIATKMPLAGGIFTGNVQFNDNIQLNFGSGADFKIKHNGSNAFLENYTGVLYIDQNQNDGNLILRNDNGSGGLVEYIVCDGGGGGVKIKHYGTTKLETTSAGVTVTGTITASGYNNTNWDTAYGWGNHASAGYLASSSYTASDVLTKIKTVDGSSSGLDADLLDGLDSTGFVKQLSDATSPDYTTPSSRRVDPNSSNPTNEHYAISTFGNNGNVTGQLAVHLSNGSGYLRSHNNSWSGWRKIWTDNNDGSGSGLDADKLDGLHASSFLQSESDTLATVTGRGASTTVSIESSGITSGTTAGNRAFQVNTTTKGALHSTSAAGGTNGSADTAPLITFTGNGTSIQGGIYVSQNASTGTTLGFFTTDSYAAGPKQSLTIEDGGNVYVNRGFLQASSDLRAPIFYDSDDTSRYINPGGTSVLHIIQSTSAQATPRYDTAFYVLQAQHWYGDTGSQTMYLGESGNDVLIRGQVAIGGTAIQSGYSLTMTGAIDMNNSSIDYVSQLHFNDNVRFYEEGNDQYLNFKSGSTSLGGIIIRDGNSTVKGYIGYWDSGGYGILEGGSWWLGTPSDERYLIIGGHGGINAYNSNTGRKLMFGGGNSDAQDNYYIGTNLENYGGNYNKLDFRWHTGIRMGAQSQYGGIRIYDSEDMGSVIFQFNVSGVNKSHTDLHAPILYDYNDTNYYVNPNSTSQIRKTNLIASGSGWDDGLNLYSSDGSNRWNVLVDNGTGDYFRIAYNNSEKFRIQTDGEVFTVGTGKAGGDFRAPIFYDSDDTNYYINANSTSNTYAMVAYQYQGNGNVGGTGSASWHPSGIYSAGYNWLYGGINGGNGSATNFSDVRARIFYDYDNTGYYMDPNSLSQLHTIDFNGILSGTNSGAAQIGRNHAYDTLELKGYGAELMIGAQHTEININYRTCNNGAGGHTPTTWKWRAGASNNWSDHYMGLIESSSSMRAPIFYDSNNTGYYTNPDGTSNIYGLTVNQQISGSISGSSNSVAITGYGNGNFTFYQTSGSFDVFSGWHNYFIGNHGSGSSYYHTMIAFPFWDSPRYSRREGGTLRGPFDFLTNERDHTTGYILQSNASLRAPIFYDSDNTGYYTDPAGLSVMHSLKLIKHQNHTPRWDFSCYVLETPHHYSTSSTGSMYVGETNTIYLRTTAISTGDHRAPIYYDYTNTGYYANPDSNSNLYSVSLYNISTISRLQSGGNLNGAQNFAFGNSGTLGSATSNSSNNAAIGHSSQASNSSGDSNFSFGYASLYSLTSGSNNIAMGDACGYNVTSGSNNLLFGHNAGRTGYQTPQSIAGITTGSNQIHMGNESHTNAYIQISWTVNSDARDKTDITPINIGLDFVNQLNPVTFRWDKRSDYEDRTPTGENKLEELTLGFLAQEVEEVEKSYGYDVATKTNLVVDRNVEQDHFGITYEKMIPILTKAIQEQQTIIDDLKSRIETLENQ